MSVSLVFCYFLTKIRQIWGYFHFWMTYLSEILLVCYFLSEIRKIWGYLHFWMIYLSEIFLRHSLDIGSLVFTLLGWAYILTSEFLCAGLNFETFDCVTFWFPGSASETSGLVYPHFHHIYSIGLPFPCLQLSIDLLCSAS